jgi:prepilin-type N-terminal cleavage/methylation domain-containing protein
MPHAAHTLLARVAPATVGQPSRAAAPPPRRRARRAGFTIAEMMVVMAVAAILALLAGPKIVGMRERASLNAARQQLAATVDAARSAAIQRGRRATVRRSGSRLIAEVDTAQRGQAPQMMQVMVAGPFDSIYHVRMQLTGGSATDTLVTWDGRGFLMPRRTTDAHFIVQNPAGRDSVCVSKIGVILPRRCMP